MQVKIHDVTPKKPVYREADSTMQSNSAKRDIKYELQLSMITKKQDNI